MNDPHALHLTRQYAAFGEGLGLAADGTLWVPTSGFQMTCTRCGARIKGTGWGDQHDGKSLPETAICAKHVHLTTGPVVVYKPYRGWGAWAVDALGQSWRESPTPIPDTPCAHCGAPVVSGAAYWRCVADGRVQHAHHVSLLVGHQPPDPTAYRANLQAKGWPLAELEGPTA